MSEPINNEQSVDAPTSEEKPDVGVQSNGDWIGLKLQNSTGVQFKILAVKLIDGKFYRDPQDKDSEIPPESLIGTIIESKGSFTLYSCGQNGATLGTEGTVTIGYQGTSNIGIYWNVPYILKNALTATVWTGPYWAMPTSHVPSSGPIGNITVEFGDKPT